jgi:N-acetylglucosaminyl-diphospho-decaprenol L-rhamnosyltransferase
VDVSVCIANWNCRELLHGCLQSLLDYPQRVRFEVIVVDNASSDGAAEMVAREFPEVLLVRNSTNRGFSKANNQAAEESRGRFLFFLNNDTVVPPGTLRRLVDYAERHPEIGMLGPRWRDGQGHFQVSVRQQPTIAALLHKLTLLRWTGLFKAAYRRYRRQDFDPQMTRCVDVLLGAAVLLPRELFFASGGWNEEFTFGGEDLELSARINQMAKVVYWPKAEIVHFGRASSRLHNGFASSQLAIGWVRYLRKIGYGRGAMLAYKTIVTLDAPVHMLGKMLQAAWRWLMHQPTAAIRSWRAARGTIHFLTRGLVPFWLA